MSGLYFLFLQLDQHGNGSGNRAANDVPIVPERFRKPHLFRIGARSRPPRACLFDTGLSIRPLQYHYAPQAGAFACLLSRLVCPFSGPRNDGHLATQSQSK